MNQVITIDYKQLEMLRQSAIAKQRRTLNKDMILPAENEIERDIAGEHTSEPIKDINDINRISAYLIGKERYRDNMLFIVGINFGLRVSDLLKLRFCDLINNDLTFKETFAILEQKTSTTRNTKRNRHITINDAVIESVKLYLSHNKCKLDDYMFRSQSNRGSNTNTPMTRKSVDRIMKEIGESLELKNKMATHTLRKTFAYHQMLMSKNDPRKLLLLQKIFGHSSPTMTLDYIGITNEEINKAYKDLNLGSNNHYPVDSEIE